jgi:hypothetical protein
MSGPLARLDRDAAELLGRVLPRRTTGRLFGAALGVLVVGLALLVGSLRVGELLWLPLSLLATAVVLLALAVALPARQERPS